MQLNFFAFVANMAFFQGFICAIHGLEYEISRNHFFPFSETFTLFCDGEERLANIVSDPETAVTESQSDDADSHSNHNADDKKSSINIYRGARTVDSTLLVEDNMLLNTSISIYSYDNDSRTLNISNIPHDVVYVCSCLREHVNKRRWEWTRDVNYLYIANGSTEGIPNTSHCLLITGVDGVLIAGVAIDLLCMFNKSINVTFQGSTGSAVFTRKVNASECSKHGTGVGLCTYRLTNATMEIDATQLICLPEGERTESNDLCSHVPTLSVIPRFTVVLTSDSDAISEGGSVTFTCSSNVPVMTNVIEWQTNDDFQANYDLSENSGESQMKISNFRCNSTINSEIQVSCKIIFSDNVMAREAFSVNIKKPGTPTPIGLNPVNVFTIAVLASAGGVILILSFPLLIIRMYKRTSRNKLDRQPRKESPEINQMTDNHQLFQRQLHHGGEEPHQNHQSQHQSHQIQHHNERDEEREWKDEEDCDDCDSDYSEAVIPKRTSSHYNKPGNYVNVGENMW